MGSAWPLSGCTEHRHSLPSAVYRNGWLVLHQCCGLMSKDRPLFFFFYIFLHMTEILFHICVTCATFQLAVGLSQA